VIEHVTFLRLEETAALLVAHEGVVFPAVPQADDDLRELTRPFVAFGVCEMRIAVEIERFRLARRGDEVPAGPPAADVVERGKLAGDVKRLVVGGRGGGDESEPLRHRCQAGEQGQRLELDDVARRAARRLDILVPHGQAVREEHRMELRAFGRPRQLNIMSEVDAGIRLALRMTPGRDVMPGRVNEGV
jgi:hypothetical protein